MEVRRLGWAGFEIESQGRRAVIDLFRNAGAMERLVGAPRGELPAPADGSISLALVTHLHEDHTDARALARALAPDGVVLRPAPATGSGMETAALAAAEAGLAQHGLTTRIVQPWERIEAGPFAVTAIPAVDGFGDPQLSWVVAADDRRLIHCGDTLFHGWWWLARERCGPFDLALLPVNGPIVDLPHRQPHSTLPAAMDPRQAAEAAAILQARLAVPMHYDQLDNPPIYAQVDRPAEAFMQAAGERGANARIVAVGERL